MGAVTIIGSGNGGFAAASHLASQGHSVTLFEFEEFYESITEIQKTKFINLDTLPNTGMESGKFAISNITTSAEEAVKSAEIIFVITPAFAHEKVAQVFSDYLTNEHVIVLAPGYMHGALFFNSVFRKTKKPHEVPTIIELESMMYACRKTEKDRVWVRGYKHNLKAATFPGKNKWAFEILKRYYPYMQHSQSVLETSVSNPNPIIHVPIMLMNAGCIDRKTDLLMYHEGLTDSIASLVLSIDEERQLINRKNLVKILPLVKTEGNWYGHQGLPQTTDLVELNRGNKMYAWSKLPTDLQNRYLTEDVPYGLIPLAELIEISGKYPTLCEALARVACAITQNNFFKTARTLSKIGLKINSIEELYEITNSGI